MIKTLIEIGKSLRDLYPMPLVENPYPSPKSKNKPIVIIVNIHTEELSKVPTIDMADFDPKSNLTKYFFRNPASSHGPAASLSFKLPGKPSALRERLGVLKVLGYVVNIESLAQEIENKLNTLKSDGKISKFTPILIVLKVDNKWPSENERLQESFTKNYLNTLANYKGKSIWKTTGYCHGCGKETIVYGGIGNLLKFYTVDKYGYAPELNPKTSWKQYALCEDCIFDLERGKRAVDDFLKWHFYGKEFWLLPVSTGNLRKVLDRFKNFYAELRGKTHKEGYESLEDRLLYEASIQEEAISYHFVFIQKDNQALRIKLHIEEVLPSMLQKYLNMKKELEDGFKDFVNEASIASHFSFNFFSYTNLKVANQKPGFTDEDFYMLVDKVFRRSPVNELYLISKAMSRISKDMAEAGEDMDKIKFILKTSVLETLFSLEFLLMWGILKRKIGGVDMSELPYEEFFEKHGDFFNHPAKRALVLLGVLVQKFLHYQHSQRESTPFLKVLKNLKLDQKDAQSVFVSLQNKMNEYEIGHWWPELREGIALNFVEAGDKWLLSPDEIGFYIAVGMSLHSHPIFGRSRIPENIANN